MTRVVPPPPPPRTVRLGGVVRYNHQPPAGIWRYLWKMGVRVDAHFCFAMLEWWEALIIGLIVLPITGLFWYSAFTYFPAHFRYLSRRFAYYVFGDEGVDLVACLRTWFAEWLNLAWMWLRGGPSSVAGAGGSVGRAAIEL